MTHRTVWSCDLCGADIASMDVRTFYAGPANTIYPAREIGPCCWQQPIQRLIAAFGKPKAAPAPSGSLTEGTS